MDKRLECVVADSEGNFHRTRKIDTFDPFIVDEELIVVTNHFINVLNKTLNEYNLSAGDCHSKLVHICSYSINSDNPL